MKTNLITGIIVFGTIVTVMIFLKYLTDKSVDDYCSHTPQTELVDSNNWKGCLRVMK